MPQRTDELTAANIRQSFRLLETSIPEPDAAFQSFLQSQARDSSPPMIKGVLSFHPLMYSLAGRTRCAQETIFGLYALQRAVRGALMAVNFQAAAERALTDELYGPAVTASYTAAFHALHAFLSLRGRVFLDMLWRPGDSHLSVAVLTRNNKWIFERRPVAAHRGRWRELQQIFVGREDDLPACFHELFAYLFRGQHQPGISMVEIIRNPGKYHLQMRDRFEVFLGRIAEARHAAIYAAAGEDPDVVGALIDRDTFSSVGIDGHARAFVAFGEGLLRTTTDEILARLAEINASPGLRTLISLGVRMPWFDEPKIPMLASAQLQSTFAVIDQWLDFASEDEWNAWRRER